ncbi:MAG: hypothetical protein IPL40_04890 [Proteobacteria bacterium]|nr:hypothetical protein [Pseudomonadota bacterium]
MSRGPAILVLLGLQAPQLLGGSALAAAAPPPRRLAALAAATGLLAGLAPELSAAATLVPETAQGATALGSELVGVLAADHGESLRTIGDSAQAAYQSLRPLAVSAGDGAMALFAHGFSYVREFPGYAAADVGAGTAGAFAARLAGRTIKLGVGVGLVAAGLVAAGALEPTSIQLATEQAAQAAAGVAEAGRHAAAVVVGTLREAPWYDRALAHAQDFVAGWGEHALRHVGMTALFTTTGLAFGRQAVAGAVTGPFRIWQAKQR